MSENTWFIYLAHCLWLEGKFHSIWLQGEIATYPSGVYPVFSHHPYMCPHFLVWTLWVWFGFLFCFVLFFWVFIEFVAVLLCFKFWVLGLETCGILAPQPGIQPTSPALEKEVSTTGSPGKSPHSWPFHLVGSCPFLKTENKYNLSNIFFLPINCSLAKLSITWCVISYLDIFMHLLFSR